jgi:hypothetical protein
MRRAGDIRKTRLLAHIESAGAWLVHVGEIGKPRKILRAVPAHPRLLDRIGTNRLREVENDPGSNVAQCRNDSFEIDKPGGSPMVPLERRDLDLASTKFDGRESLTAALRTARNPGRYLRIVCLDGQIDH